MSFLEILATILSYVLGIGCFSLYVGLLVFTIGLREIQTNLKIREIGKSLFKKFF